MKGEDAKIQKSCLDPSSGEEKTSLGLLDQTQRLCAAESSKKNGSQYVRMIFDSGASCSAFPREIGDTYGLKEDEYVGYQYHGAGGETIEDEGSRRIQFHDENWNPKKISYRVAKMRNPLVAASQTVHAGNLVVMDENHSFIAPLTSEIGWRLRKAIADLVWKYGTDEITSLYESNGIYCFDAWINQVL